MTRLGVALILAVVSGIAADRNAPGPSWDPRPEWQREKEGPWQAVLKRRAVTVEAPSEIVPVAESRPFRIPRAMMAAPVEVAPAVTPLAEGAPGRIKASPCKKELNYQAPKSTAGEDARFVAELEKVIAVVKANPAFPPLGFEVLMGCGFERRGDGSGLYMGRITLLFYPDSDKNHYWHGGLEILVNDLGVMGPRANATDRMTDPRRAFDLPAPATYRGKPWLAAEHGVWGGLYLTKRPERIYSPVTYREWIAENLPRLESEARELQAKAQASPTVRNQFAARNWQSMYERTLITSQKMPAAEQDTPVWIYDLAPSDAANPDSVRQVRLSLPGYFDRAAPIQLINILPLHGKYNHLHVVLEKLDYEALMAMVT